MPERLDVENATMLVTVETVYAVPMSDFAVEEWTETALRKGDQHERARNCYVTGIRATTAMPASDLVRDD